MALREMKVSHRHRRAPSDTLVQTKWFSVTLDPTVVEGIIGMHKSMREGEFEEEPDPVQAC